MNNPPAFPRTAGQFIEDENACVHEAQDGMTLRDYFAAKAMAVIIQETMRTAKVSEGIAAKAAYEIADAMLEERAKR